jgi:hypothetical protein
MQQNATNFIRACHKEISFEQNAAKSIKSHNSKKRRQTSLATDYYRPFSTYSITYFAANSEKPHKDEISKENLTTAERHKISL